MTRERSWQIVRGGGVIEGPFTCQQLRQMLQNGELREDDPVLDEGGSLWGAAAAVRHSDPPPVPVLTPAAAVTAHLHRDGATSLAFSADGRFLASGGFDCCVRVWDVQAAKLVVNFHPGFKEGDAEIVGHDATVSHVAFSADGTEVASADWGGRVCVWDLKAHRQRVALEGHKGAVNCLGYLSAGMEWSGSKLAQRIGKRTLGLAGYRSTFLLSGGADGTLRIWNTMSGNESRCVPGFGPVSHFALDPDGQHVWLAVTPRERPPHHFFLADLRKSEQSVVFATQVPGIRHVAVAGDERHVAVSSADERVRVWAIGDRLNKDPDHDQRASQGELLGVAFSADSRLLASAGSDGTVKLWNPETGDLLATCRGHQGDARDVAFCPDGQRMASCGKDGRVLIWDVSSVKAVN